MGFDAGRPAVAALPLRYCVAAGSPPTSSQPGPARTTTRTESGYERGHVGGKVSQRESTERFEIGGEIGAGERHEQP
jgi:hypothetical protein